MAKQNVRYLVLVTDEFLVSEEIGPLLWEEQAARLPKHLGFHWYI